MKKVKAPDGNTYEIPDDQVEAALASGGVLAEAEGNVATSGMGLLGPTSQEAAESVKKQIVGAGAGGVQGLTSEFADEIYGAIKAPLSDQSYEEARDEARQFFQKAQEEAPIAYGASEIAGSIASPIGKLGSLKKIDRLKDIVDAFEKRKIASTVAEGALEGGLFEAGASTGDDTLSEFSKGASLGGGISLGSRLVGPKLGTVLGTTAGGTAGLLAGGSVIGEEDTAMESLAKMGAGTVAGALAGGKIGRSFGKQNIADKVNTLGFKEVEDKFVNPMLEASQITTPLKGKEALEEFKNVTRFKAPDKIVGLLDESYKKASDFYNQATDFAKRDNVRVNLKPQLDKAVSEVDKLEKLTQLDVDKSTLKNLKKYLKSTSRGNKLVDTKNLDLDKIKEILTVLKTTKNELSSVNRKQLSDVIDSIEDFTSDTVKNLSKDTYESLEKGKRLYRSTREVEEKLINVDQKPENFGTQKDRIESIKKLIRDKASSDINPDFTSEGVSWYRRLTDPALKGTNPVEEAKFLTTSPEATDLIRSINKEIEEVLPEERTYQRLTGDVQQTVTDTGGGGGGMYGRVMRALGLTPANIGYSYYGPTKRWSADKIARFEKAFPKMSKGVSNTVKELLENPDRSRKAALIFSLQQTPEGRQVLEDFQLDSEGESNE